MNKSIVAIIGISILVILTSTASAVYNPKLGRFAQRDPVGYVDGMNLYEYVKSSPLKWVDPMGLETYYDPGFHGYVAQANLQETEIPIWPGLDLYRLRRKPYPKNFKLKEALGGLRKALQDKCEKCCGAENNKCCKMEAAKIANAILRQVAWFYGRGPHTRKNNKGGFMCWDWAQSFEDAIKSTGKITQWNHYQVRLTTGMKTGDKLHFYVKLHACKDKKEGCTVKLDDGAFKDGWVHTEASWPLGKYKNWVYDPEATSEKVVINQARPYFHNPTVDKDKIIPMPVPAKIINLNK